MYMKDLEQKVVQNGECLFLALHFNVLFNTKPGIWLCFDMCHRAI